MKELKKPAHCRLPKGCPQSDQTLYLAVTTFNLLRKRFFLNLHPPEPLPHYGDEEARTPDLRRAKAALSQLSYIPGQIVQPKGGPGWTRTNDLSLIRGTL